MLLELLLNHGVHLCLFWHIWVAHETLLLSIFPHLKVPHFDVFQDNFEREVIGEIRGYLAILPGFQVRSLDQAPNTLQDGVN